VPNPNAGTRHDLRDSGECRDTPPERLGKIEKFILLWVLRRKDAVDEFHFRSAALQAYYKQSQGLTFQTRNNARSVIPVREYRSLQVRFTNALGCLRRKGYVEIHRGRAGWRIEWSDSEVWEATSTIDWWPLRPWLVTGTVAFRHDGQPVLPLRSQRWFDGQPLEVRNVENRGRHVVHFRLTPAGRARARALARGQIVLPTVQPKLRKALGSASVQSSKT